MQDCFEGVASRADSAIEIKLCYSFDVHQFWVLYPLDIRELGTIV
jgi:hypothetical protein